MSTTRYSLKQINALDEDEFLRAFGPVFERSPWVAQAAWSERPFASLEQLHQRMCHAVHASGAQRQLELIRAHPDLAATLTGPLSAHSASEQASAGLDRLSAEELARFSEYNRRYRARFGFPFVICARLNKKEAILTAFPVRLENSPEQEIQAALQEIYRIARLRLENLIRG